MPRAKFIQTLVLNVIGICIGSAIALLGIWSGVKAREHTTPAGSTAAYNSSQAAVCAIWLTVNIYFVNTLRARLPALQFPVILYSIFTSVALTYGPLFQTIAQGEALIRRLLLAFLTAFGLATGVNLFFIPVSSRTVVFGEQAGYINLIRAALKAQMAFLQSLESSDMFAETESKKESDDGNGHEKDKKSRKHSKKKQGHPAETAQSKALKGAITGLTTLHGKLHGDIPFAKREVAWGKLNGKDFDEIFRLLRGILIPLIGMSTISDVFQRIAERRGWVKLHNPGHRDRLESWDHCTEAEQLEEKKTWNEVMKALHEPFSVAVSAMDEAMEHAGLVLEILPKPKKKKGVDEEAKGFDPRPGESTFTAYMEKKMEEFYGKRGSVLRAWAKEKGLSKDHFDNAKSIPLDGSDPSPDELQHRMYTRHNPFQTPLSIPVRQIM